VIPKNKVYLDALVEHTTDALNKEGGGSGKFAIHPGQRRLLDAFINGERFMVWLAGRRCGKTTTVCMIAAYCLGHRGARIRVVAPQYRLCKKVWNPLVPMLKQLYGKKTISINKSDMLITTPWDASLELCTAENPDSMLGEGLDLVIVDEAARIKPIVWQMYISPSIRDRKGSVIFISTPKGKNWLYDIYQKGMNKIDGWWGQKSVSFENTAVWDEEEIESVKAHTDDMEFQQEYLAECISFAGRVYPTFKEETHILQEIPEGIQITDESENVGWEHYVSIDPGYANKLAMLWIAHHPVTGESVIYKEVCKTRLEYPEIVQAIKANEPLVGYKGFIVDIAGKGKDNSGLSFVDNIEQSDYFREKGYYFEFHRSIIEESLPTVRQALMNNNGEIKLFVMQYCPDVIKGFINYEYKDGSEDPRKDGVHDHPMDAIRYYIVHIQESSVVYGYTRL
jgi:hypothetical protein